MATETWSTPSVTTGTESESWTTATGAEMAYTAYTSTGTTEAWSNV